MGKATSKVPKTGIEPLAACPPAWRRVQRSAVHSNLPKFTMPNLPERGSFRMFPISGDSMLPIPDGSDVIAEYVQDWKTIKAGTLCILILKAEQDFVFKQVTVLEDGQFLLTSLNTQYHPYTVAAEDVVEIWKYYKYQSAALPEPTTDLQEIKRLILNLKEGIGQIQKPG